ncbi:MAG: ATPase domain-containing protein [Candidatus Micrarchaeota archaeon]
MKKKKEGLDAVPKMDEPVLVGAKIPQQEQDALMKESGIEDISGESEKQSENEDVETARDDIEILEGLAADSGPSPKKESVRKTRSSGIDFDAIRKSIQSELEKPEKKNQTPVPRASTGIPGLDEVLGGGFPVGSLVLLSGTAGSGKSTFGMQFLYDGALKGEPGVYVTLEEEPSKLTADLSLYGWDLKKMISEKKLLITKPAIYKFTALLQTIEDALEKTRAKRLVIDSSTLLSMYFDKAFEVRRGLADLDRQIKKFNVTTLAISEVHETEHKLSSTGVEEFIVDGIVLMHVIKQGNDYARGLSVRKMRAVDHTLKIMPLVIGADGLRVYPSEEVFAETV